MGVPRHRAVAAVLAAVVLAACGGGDGTACELNLSNLASFDKGPRPESALMTATEVDAFADCLFELLETYGQQYRDLAVGFLGA